MEKGLLFLPMILCFTCSCHEMIQNVEHLRDTISYEKVSYFKHPVLASDKPFRYRLTYYYENGEPHRWMELDDSGRVITDYIYEYDSSWTQTGARYREESAVEFSIEKVRFESDSTKITEWIDSTGRVYYKMIDNLNADGKTYRASFIGDKLHGYDSTFYTEEGFVKRIFFTNTKGKTYNDRSFNYDSLNQNGDWTIRTKVMADTIREIHKREVYYDNWFITGNGKFYEGILSTGELSENVINFSMDESIVFLTRTSNWTEQTAFIAYNKYGVFTAATPIRELGDIYNGAISPKGDKIIFSVKDQDNEDIWLIKKKDGQWSDKMNLTKSSHLHGGYFYWFSNTEIYFYQNKSNGDIFVGEIDDGKLTVTDSLASINSKAATEFSPFVDKEKRFLIFSRYEDGDKSNQGFFVSYNHGELENPIWSKPQKLSMLPYGWSAFIINDGNQFVYTDGEDIYGVPIELLKLKIK